MKQLNYSFSLAGFAVMVLATNNSNVYGQYAYDFSSAAPSGQML